MTAGNDENPCPEHCAGYWDVVEVGSFTGLFGGVGVIVYVHEDGCKTIEDEKGRVTTPNSEVLQSPKLQNAGPAALPLYLACVAYAERFQTDGRVPATLIETLVDWDGVCQRVAGYVRGDWEMLRPDELVHVLLDVGLLERDESDDLVVRDWCS
jgi:hypothetical protein